MSWFDNKEISSWVDAISWNILSKKNIYIYNDIGRERKMKNN